MFSSYAATDVLFKSRTTYFSVSLQQLVVLAKMMGLMELTCVGALDRYQTDLHAF